MNAVKGDRFVDFCLNDQFGNKRTLADFLGKPFVLFIYPTDDSGGCTIEACAFRDAYEDFKDLGCEVIGVSEGDEASKLHFAQKRNLDFVLLADPENSFRKQYRIENDFFGLIKGRVTFVVDGQGIIQEIFNSGVFFKKHMKVALETVRSLK